MNKAWMGLEIAPQGSMKNKIHGFVLKTFLEAMALVCVFDRINVELWSLCLYV